MKVRYTKTALRQLDEALAYVTEQNPQIARPFRDRIQALVAFLALHPSAGQATDRPNQRRMVTNPYPYLIFYRVHREEIIIQRIRHGARRPV